MKLPLFLFGFVLSFMFISSAEARTYGNYGGGSSGYASRYGGGGSGIYSGAWRGDRSHYIRNFGRSSGGGYFGVPTGSSVGGSSFISRKHRTAHQAKLRRIRQEQARLNNAPAPCGAYGRAPKSCVTTRYNTQQQ